jgi:hypothetical protein
MPPDYCFLGCAPKQTPCQYGAFYRKMVLLLKQPNLYLNRFPKHEKYALCQSIRNDGYLVFDLMVEGHKRYYKKTTLTELDIAIERLRMKLLLAYELEYFNYRTKNDETERDPLAGEKRYSAISQMIDEIGRIAGAWIKSVKETEKW